LVAACFASLEGVKEETHRQVRFRRWVWKLALALRQFLPSPEAPVVLVLVIIVDVVVERDDMSALIELARDNITRDQSSTWKCGDQFKVLL